MAGAANKRAFPCAPGHGYDFVVWLVEAELTRRREKAPAPLQVAFAHPERLDDIGRDWLKNVWRPALSLIGAVENRKIEDDRAPFLSYEHMFNAIVRAVEQGEEIPQLQASMIARQTVGEFLAERHIERPIVITLREADYDRHRNSNLDAWRQFAQSLEERVIFLRDTAKGQESVEGFFTYWLAARSLRLRMALYEQAKMNFFVSNGPFALAMFSSVPYFIFQTQYAGSHGAQYPWAKDNQRIVFQVDNFTHISRAWKETALNSLALPANLHLSG